MVHALEVKDKEGAHNILAAHRADPALRLLPVAHAKGFDVVGKGLLKPLLGRSRAIVHLTRLVRKSGCIEHVVNVLAFLPHLAPETHGVEENRCRESNRQNHQRDELPARLCELQPENEAEDEDNNAKRPDRERREQDRHGLLVGDARDRLLDQLDALVAKKCKDADHNHHRQPQHVRAVLREAIGLV